jgi:hypothetical protein
MKHILTDKQVKQIIEKGETLLKSLFNDDDRICGFKIFLNEERIDDDDSVFDVYVLLNKKWVIEDNWSTFRSGHIRDKVKQTASQIISKNIEVYSYAKDCK